VGGDRSAVEGGHDMLEVGGDHDATPDRARVHRVVVAVEADVVIPRQAQTARPTHRRGDRGQRQHRGVVGLPALDGSTPQPAVMALVGPGQPDTELEVEVRR